MRFFVTICYSSTLLLLLSCYHHFFPRVPLCPLLKNLLLRASRLPNAHNSQFVFGVDTSDLGSWFLPSFATLHLLLTLLLRNLNHAPSIYASSAVRLARVVGKERSAISDTISIKLK